MKRIEKLRKSLFTNKFSECIFLSLQKVPVLKSLTFKFLAGNHLYAKNSIRNVERNNIKYHLDISDYQEWLIYANSDSDSSNGVINYLNNSQIVLDIGANVGQTSLWMDQYLKNKGLNYHIYAFEPHPITYYKLSTNLNLNQSTKITPFNIGLSNIHSELELVEDCETNSGGFRIGKISPTQKGVKIPVTTIDDFVKENQIKSIDFIKIDVEGFEFKVLQGAAGILRLQHPNLYIEFCPQNLMEQSDSPEQIIQFLIEFGYTIIDVNSELKDNELYSFKGMTDIFCFVNRNDTVILN